MVETLDKYLPYCFYLAKNMAPGRFHKRTGGLLSTIGTGILNLFGVKTSEQKAQEAEQQRQLQEQQKQQEEEQRKQEELKKKQEEYEKKQKLLAAKLPTPAVRGVGGM